MFLSMIVFLLACDCKTSFCCMSKKPCQSTIKKQVKCQNLNEMYDIDTIQSYVRFLFHCNTLLKGKQKKIGSNILQQLSTK